MKCFLDRQGEGLRLDQKQSRDVNFQQVKQRPGVKKGMLRIKS